MDSDAAWLPLCFFGTCDTPLPPGLEKEDTDDEELPETPPDVVMMLGFDPRDMDWDADDNELRTAAAG